jgi:hypothetical protein
MWGRVATACTVVGMALAIPFTLVQGAQHVAQQQVEHSTTTHQH